MNALLPADGARRTVREQVRVNEEAGWSPLRARLAVLDRLARARARELEHVGRYAPGRYRALKEAAVVDFWYEFWSCLRFHLEAGAADEASALLDEAIDRVEPEGGG